MGAPMAAHVLAAGHELAVWNRTPGKAGPLIEAGAREASSPARDAARDADALVLALFGPPQVGDEALFGAASAASVMPEGSAVVTAPRGCAEPPLRRRSCPVRSALCRRTAVRVGRARADRNAEHLRRRKPRGSSVSVRCSPAGQRRTAPTTPARWALARRSSLVRNMGHGIATAAIGECLRLADELGIDRDLAMSTVAVGVDVPTEGGRGCAARLLGRRVALDLMTKHLALAVDEARVRRRSPSAHAQARQAVDDGLGRQDYIALADWVGSTEAVRNLP